VAYIRGVILCFICVCVMCVCGCVCVSVNQNFWRGGVDLWGTVLELLKWKNF